MNRTNPISSAQAVVDNNRMKREAPGPHFEKVAKVWSVITGSTISPEQVLLCMAALKIVREAGQHDPDNALDGQGYLHMIDEVRSWMGRNEQVRADQQTTGSAKVYTGGGLYVDEPPRREFFPDS